jgi:hypothetical protein
MRIRILGLILAVVLTVSCAAPVTPEPTLADSPGDAPVAEVDPSPTPDPSIPRTAVFSEVENEVQRAEAASEFVLALPGDILNLGGQAQSGPDGRARLDLTPDGTIVRVGPNSMFILAAFSEFADPPQTTLELFLGQLWIILNGGTLDIQTQTGLATVRGSLMSVGYDPQTGDMTVTCLEGHCTLGNHLGTVDLTAGQASQIPGLDHAPNPPRPMSPDELQAWVDEIPESLPFFPGSDEPQAGPLPGSDPGPGGPPPADSAAFNEPITYSFTNQCWAAWHWTFEGDSNHSVDVPPGETVSGQIPPGIYQVHDWADDGFDNGTYEVIGGSDLDPTYHCPPPDGAPEGGGGDAPPPPPDTDTSP